MTTLTVLAVLALAADPPPVPTPAAEHALLKKLVGEWEFTMSCVMAPGQPPMKGSGTESVKSIGGLWIVGELTGKMDGMTMTGITTVGFDPAKKKYVGTWVCSMDTRLTTYEGEADAAGTTLTLFCDGTSPLDPTKTVKMKDVTTFKPDGGKVLTSYMQGPDGKWAEFMTLTAKRKK